MPTPIATTPSARRTTTPPKGFTLIELLVVIVIIVILVGLLVPALSGARKAAKKAATRSSMQSFLAACASFKNDKQRQPGAIPVDFLGLPRNDASQAGGYGISTAQSAILDLAGGVVARGNNATGNNVPDAPQAELVYPGLDRTLVNIGSIGAVDGPQYIKLSREAFGVVNGRINSTNPLTLNPDGTPKPGFHPQALIPEPIDADGMPIVMWMADPLASEDAEFAHKYTSRNPGSPPGVVARPKFTWTANSGIFCASQLGKPRTNQSTDTLLGQKVASNPPLRGVQPSFEEITGAMRALLGNPQFPTRRSPVKAPTDFGTINTENAGAGSGGGGGIDYPSAAKGEIIMHAAGADNIFLKRPRPGATLSYLKPQNPAGQDPYEAVIDEFDDFTESQ
jgi:prepilin-type N-terminal cleavage/methylation domain-containing protein